MQISEFSKHIFWSYNKEANLPDDLVIFQIANFGEIEDMQKLMEHFDKSYIHEILSGSKPQNKKRVHFFSQVFLS